MKTPLNSKNIYLIYSGGTFGSHGTPLAPLDTNLFLPILNDLLNKRLVSIQEFLPNTLIKDSSTLTPIDFVHFYELIINAYHQGARKFVLIVGTDTLSFLSAFLANALAELDELSLVITGSMQPLLLAHHSQYCVDDNSDAWQNLTGAITTALNHIGTFVYFYHKVLPAINTQKINSHQYDAFVGLPVIQAPKPFLSVNLHLIKQRVQNAIIQSIYVLPNEPDELARQLQCLNPETKAVILIAFGTGNLPQSNKIIDELQKLHQKSIAVVCTSMCAFGGVSSDYLAGSWQYEYGVWSGGQLGIAGIYGKLLWLYLNGKLTKHNWEFTS